MICCSKCGGHNVQVATWVNPNTDEILEEFGSWNETDTKFCVDCQENVELVDGSLQEEESCPS